MTNGKTCKGCGLLLSDTNFYGTSGRNCKTCHNKITAEQRQRRLAVSKILGATARTRRIGHYHSLGVQRALVDAAWAQDWSKLGADCRRLLGTSAKAAISRSRYDKLRDYAGDLSSNSPLSFGMGVGLILKRVRLAKLEEVARRLHHYPDLLPTPKKVSGKMRLGQVVARCSYDR